MDADAEAQRSAQLVRQFRAENLETAPNFQTRLKCIARRQRGGPLHSEDAHHAIPGDASRVTSIAPNRFGDRLDISVEDEERIERQSAGGKPGRLTQINKHGGDLELPAAGYRGVEPNR